MDEAAFWLPGHSALVLGDSVLGYEDGVSLCPESWLRKGESLERLRASANRAVAKRPRWLLLTHGGPREISEALEV
jgi:glyoxylase-like metal-dependent hydrolase (beta-lactamase superfamily II)